MSRLPAFTLVYSLFYFYALYFNVILYLAIRTDTTNYRCKVFCRYILQQLQVYIHPDGSSLAFDKHGFSKYGRGLLKFNSLDPIPPLGTRLCLYYSARSRPP